MGIDAKDKSKYACRETDCPKCEGKKFEVCQVNGWSGRRVWLTCLECGNRFSIKSSEDYCAAEPAHVFEEDIQSILMRCSDIRGLHGHPYVILKDFAWFVEALVGDGSSLPVIGDITRRVNEDHGFGIPGRAIGEVEEEEEKYVHEKYGELFVNAAEHAEDSLRKYALKYLEYCEEKYGRRRKKGL